MLCMVCVLHWQGRYKLWGPHEGRFCLNDGSAGHRSNAWSVKEVYLQEVQEGAVDEQRLTISSRLRNIRFYNGFARHWLSVAPILRVEKYTSPSLFFPSRLYSAVVLFPCLHNRNWDLVSHGRISCPFPATGRASHLDVDSRLRYSTFILQYHLIIGLNNSWI